MPQMEAVLEAIQQAKDALDQIEVEITKGRREKPPMPEEPGPDDEAGPMPMAGKPPMLDAE